VQLGICLLFKIKNSPSLSHFYSHLLREMDLWRLCHRSEWPETPHQVASSTADSRPITDGKNNGTPASHLWGYGWRKSGILASIAVCCLPIGSAREKMRTGGEDRGACQRKARGDASSHVPESRGLYETCLTRYIGDAIHPRVRG
jgi:hypothetical protein